MLVDIFIINLLCAYVWLVYEHMHVRHSGQKGMLGVLLCHSMHHAFQAVSLTEPRTRLAAWKPRDPLASASPITEVEGTLAVSSFCGSRAFGLRSSCLHRKPSIPLQTYAVQLRCVQPYYCCSVDATCFFHCKGVGVNRTR